MPAASGKLLVVDADPRSRASIARCLCGAGFSTVEIGDVTAALTIAAAWRPDCVVIHASITDADAPRVLRDLRQDQAIHRLPVVLVSASDREADRIEGLRQGADDCIARPWSSTELVARVQAMLRRVPPAAEIIVRGRLRMDLRSQRVTGAGVPVTLRPVEFRLLRFFMSNPEIAYTRADLKGVVWTGGLNIHDRTVDVQVQRLREALTPAGCDWMIQTVRAFGYRFSALEHPHA